MKKDSKSTNKNNNKKENKVMKSTTTTNKGAKEKMQKELSKQIKVNKAERLLPPITEKQMELLVKLGVDESEFKDMDIREASSLIRELKEKGEFEKLPPKETKAKKESGSSKKTASSTATSTPNISMEMANKSVERLTEYLVNFAKEDKTFAKKFNKSRMKECLNYIGTEVYKQIKDSGNNAIMCEDDDIFKLARHFFLDVYKEKEENEGFKMKFEKTEKAKQKNGYTQVKLAFDFD